MKIIKHKCCMCGENATWYKLIHNQGDTLYYCDDCVPRHCVSNTYNTEEDGEPIPNRRVMWWGKDSKVNDFAKDGTTERQSDSLFYEYLDEDGRRRPSKNFIHNSFGFIIAKDEPTVSHNDIFQAFSYCKDALHDYQSKSIGTLITNILIDYDGLEGEGRVPYAFFMSQIGDEIKNYKSRLPLFGESYKNLTRFYTYFKKELTRMKKYPQNKAEEKMRREYMYASSM